MRLICYFIWKEITGSATEFSINIAWSYALGFFSPPSPLHCGICVSVDSCLAQMRCHKVGTLRSAGTEAALSLQIDFWKIRVLWCQTYWPKPLGSLFFFLSKTLCNKLFFSNFSPKRNLSVFCWKSRYICLKNVLRNCLKGACCPSGRPGGDWMGAEGPSEHIERCSCAVAACDGRGTCYWAWATRVSRVQLQWMGPTGGGDRGSCWKRPGASLHRGSESKWEKTHGRRSKMQLKRVNTNPSLQWSHVFNLLTGQHVWEALDFLQKEWRPGLSSGPLEKSRGGDWRNVQYSTPWGCHCEEARTHGLVRGIQNSWLHLNW